MGEHTGRVARPVRVQLGAGGGHLWWLSCSHSQNTTRVFFSLLLFPAFPLLAEPFWELAQCITLAEIKHQVYVFVRDTIFSEEGTHLAADRAALPTCFCLSVGSGSPFCTRSSFFHHPSSCSGASFWPHRTPQLNDVLLFQGRPS